jgi:N-acetylneuraminic acid mutarotase
MKRKRTSRSAFFNLRVSIAFLVFAAAACSVLSGALLAFFRSEAPASSSQRTLTFAERVGYQRAIEDVYWRHRIWPKERPDPKPSFDGGMSQAQLETKVVDYLRNSQVLEDYWQRPITAEQLQAEMDRMAQHTKQPEVLRELFEALGKDPFVIAECLARPVLAERTLAIVASLKEPSRTRAETQGPATMAAVSANYMLPQVCTDDTWTPTSLTNAPSAREGHTAVWTGSEMIVWGGGADLNTGGKYNPSTDSWTATSTVNAPAGRYRHTGVWTGSEMIVWGGEAPGVLDTGGRYNPGTNSWTATSTTNAPDAREFHTAVWTGSEMIVWGGFGSGGYLNTGGRYNPNTDSWTATSTSNAPDAREYHTAVWTGTEMVVWGGENPTGLNTGGKYDPSTDSWTATSTTNAPDARYYHTAIWTGSEMIVWGGVGLEYFNTGGRYNPNTDSWIATSITNAPAGRYFHTAVWTSSEMIVCGGHTSSFTNNTGVRHAAQFSLAILIPNPTPTPTPTFVTGGRYDPGTDSWRPTSITNAPSTRDDHTAVWTGNQMIVWGGLNGSWLNTGGRYCAAPPSPTPTPTPTATATATATPTGTPTPSSAPCSVSGLNPPCGSTVHTRLADFAVYVSDPVDPATLQSSDLMCNGIPASAVAYTPGSTTISFHFGRPPLVQGPNTMHIPAGAFNCLNGQPVLEFTCTLTGFVSREISPRPRPTPAPRP